MRYKVMKHGQPYPGTMPKVELVGHPDQPEDGFESWSAAEMWLQERFLAPHLWRVEPSDG